jgi:hypothetical protein
VMRAPALRRIRVRPAHVAVAILFAGALWVAATPINDLDSYWHVEIGREMLARHTLDGLGRQWLGVPAGNWRTSQWLSEVTMYLSVDRFGWVALPVLRLLVACSLFAVYLLTLVRRRQPVASFAVLLLLVVGLEVLFQDRPQTLSLVFVALLAAACERLWTSGSRPSLLAVGGLTLLWAQLHGLWVLAPGAFALVAFGGMLDRGHARPGQVRSALACSAASLAGLVNPQGAVSFLLPFTFRNSAESRINEWAATTFTMPLTGCWGLLICLTVVGWVRSSRRVPATELLWVFTWSVFGVLALRNVGPSMLLLAPVTVGALESAGGNRLKRLTTAPSGRESGILAGLLGVVVLLTAGFVGVAVATLDPIQNAPGLAIARRLAAVDGPVRVWNGYNVSGSLIAFGGGGDGHLKLVVDGRSDLWGGTYIGRTVDAQSLSGGWEQTFRSFHPDAVVLPPDTPLVVHLRRAQNWQVARTDHDYVLLVPPGSQLR